MIKFVHCLALFRVKTANFLPSLWQKCSKNHNIGSRWQWFTGKFLYLSNVEAGVARLFFVLLTQTLININIFHSKTPDASFLNGFTGKIFTPIQCWCQGCELFLVATREKISTFAIPRHRNGSF
jgi:hypothetical protein